MTSIRIRVLALASLLAGCLEQTSEPAPVSVQIFSPATIAFLSPGDTVSLQIGVIDARSGISLPHGLNFISRDGSVATVDQRGMVRAVGNGATWIVTAADIGTPDSVAVSVTPVYDSLVVSTDPHLSILAADYDGLVPVLCRVFDAAGVVVPATTSVSSATGKIVGTSCTDLRARHSGFDTLTVQAAGHQTRLAVAVAIRPTLLGSPDLPLSADTIPAGVLPWAPTLRQNSSGDWELYFTAYFTGRDVVGRGDLHRLVSNDGFNFFYDGIAVAKDPGDSDLRGTGIENIAIVPRAGQPGWRMFLAAGGNDSYGWQIFSAVSSDERTWVIEPGVRVSNGGTLPPLRPISPPWPVGEGIVVDQTAGGEWRMITGGYENSLPSVNKFQIVEWRSPDQIHWTYRRALLTTYQIGPAASRSLYSPSIQEVVPGLFRMYFTGGNEHMPGGRSRIYTAVSTDRARWQVEGVLLGESDADYFYSSFAGGVLAFVRQPVGTFRALGVVQVQTR